MFSKTLVFAAVLAIVDAKEHEDKKVKRDKKIKLGENRPHLQNKRTFTLEEMEATLDQTRADYHSYMQYFGKNYPYHAEVKAHHIQWVHAEAEIQTLNANSNSAHFGHNKFSDWLPAQVAKRNGRKKPETMRKNGKKKNLQGQVQIDFEVEMTNDEYQTLYDNEYAMTWMFCNEFDDWFSQNDLTFMSGQRKIHERLLVKKSKEYNNSEFDAYWSAIEDDRQANRDALVRCYQDNDDGDGGDGDVEPPTPGVCSANLSEWIWGSDVVAPVKDQGSCGSCYAFSSNVVFEGRKAIATGNLVTYSEQQIVDCQRDYADCAGCRGGWEHSLFESSKRYPIARDSVYPYTGIESTCVRPSAGDETVSAATAFYIRDTPADLKAEVCNGPITVGVAANSAFSYYRSGVLTSEQCGYNWADHAVGVIGWTVKDGVEAAIVKNSWGSDWGDNGYIYLALDTGNNGAGPCGILDTMAAATIAL